MSEHTDTERLDFMGRHYAQFVGGVSTGRPEGGWDERTTIRWREVDRSLWESGELGPFDDGKREQEFPGDFRAAIDAAIDRRTPTDSRQEPTDE